MAGGLSSTDKAIVGGVLGPVLLIAIVAITVVIIVVVFVVKVRPLYCMIVVLLSIQFNYYCNFFAHRGNRE